MPIDVRNQGSVKRILLSDNDLKHIRASDFAGTNAISIDLGYSNISQIDDNAFTGSPDLEELFLQGNAFTSLPEALARLDKITTLDVRNNPKDKMFPIDLTDHVMKEMGDSMHTFLFGHPHMTTWPRSISHFQDLKDLTLDEASRDLRVIPPTAFHSFMSTLQVLTVKNTKLVAVPLGVSTLRGIKAFYFDNNVLVHNEGIIAQAFVRPPPYNSTLETLSLSNDSLTRFPRTLAFMSSLRHLIINHNNLEFISDESIQDLTLTSLEMQHCNLDRIPGALYHLRNLERLDMSHNHLVTVENNDIQNIPHIKTLTLAYNPIKFISDSAFGSINDIDEVDLSHTQLNTIPTAFNLTHVGVVNLRDSNVDCMCAYVWVSGSVNRYEGCCVNIEESINDYVRFYVPLCPEYIEKHALSKAQEAIHATAQEQHRPLANKNCTA